MSYILEALKKSDRERQQETPSHLQSLHGTAPAFKDTSVFRGYRWPWLLLSGLLVFGGLFKWLDWHRQGIDGQTFRQSPPASAEIAGDNEQVVQPSPSLVSAVSEAAKSLDPMIINPERFNDWYQQLPKKESSMTSPGTPQPAEVEREAAAPVISPVALAAIRKKKFSEQPKKIKRDREKIVLSSESEATVIAQPLLVSSKKVEKAVPYLQDLPPQVQAEIPKMQFAGHAYALVPSQRMIIVNGKIMREGDRVDAKTKLAEITWEGVIIDRDGLRVQIKCY
jgi:general secretion pathway protein B